MDQEARLLVVGLVAGGAALLTRALPWPDAWKRRKPLGCPTCASGWLAMPTVWYAVSAGYLTAGSVWWVGFCWLAATAVGAVVNAVANPPSPQLPDLSAFDAPADPTETSDRK